MDTQTEMQPIEHAEAENQPSEPSTEPKLNDKYFLDEDPMVIFQVEDQLFRVHQYHLARGSKHFREIFADSEEARNHGQPIQLPGVTVAEFESLLDYFYKPRAESGTLQDHWKLLRVGHKCQIPEVFRFAKKKLKTPVTWLQIQPLQKLVVGKQYGFADWVTSASDTLLAREETLSVEEATAFGFSDLAGFVKAREEKLENKIKEVEASIPKPKPKPKKLK